MIEQKLPSSTFVVVFLVIGLLLGPTTAVAQEESPSVDLTNTTIDIDAGENSMVTAEYQFTVGSAGSGDSAAISSINGTLWKIPGREIGEITTTVGGESVEPSVSEQSGHLNVSVPVEDVDSDTVTVTLEYQVSGPARKLQAPLWVPEYSTPGQENVIDMTVMLPEGTTLSGDSFPSAATVDGNTVKYNLLHVPGFVKMNYGQTGAGVLTADTLYSLLGVVLIVGFIVGGLVIDRKTA